MTAERDDKPYASALILPLRFMATERCLGVHTSHRHHLGFRLGVTKVPGRVSRRRKIAQTCRYYMADGILRKTPRALPPDDLSESAYK